MPNKIERVLLLLELNIPVVNVFPLRSNIPDVNVVVALVTNDKLPPTNVVVPEVVLIVNDAIVLLFGVIVPVPTIFAVKPVNVPLVDNVNPRKFNDVVGTANAVVPKLNVLNQLPVVNVPIDVPLPVNVKLGEFVDEPPELEPKAYVLVVDASAVKPPVPV